MVLELGQIRYHLLFQFNRTVPDCAENAALEKIYDATSVEDYHAIHDAAAECDKSIWPFLEEDYVSHLKSPSDSTEVIKLQALMKNGVLICVNHNKHIEYPPTKPVDNTFPNVPVFTDSDVERIKELVTHIFKAKLYDSIYCMKTVHRTGKDANFVREVTVLQQSSHTNIISFIGLVSNVNRVHRQRADIAQRGIYLA